MNPIGMTTIVVPNELRDRLEALKTHRRQAYHEVIEAALDAWEESGAVRTRSGPAPLLRVRSFPPRDRIYP